MCAVERFMSELGRRSPEAWQQPNKLGSVLFSPAWALIGQLHGRTHNLNTVLWDKWSQWHPTKLYLGSWCTETVKWQMFAVLSCWFWVKFAICNRWLVEGLNDIIHLKSLVCTQKMVTVNWTANSMGHTCLYLFWIFINILIYNNPTAIIWYFMLLKKLYSIYIYLHIHMCLYVYICLHIYLYFYEHHICTCVCGVCVCMYVGLWVQSSLALS